MVIVKVLSGPKGGNPGGMCIISDSIHPSPAYFKYCYGSKIGRDSSFVAQHQPIYEAMTFELAQEIGLKTTSYYILMNSKERPVVFKGWKECGLSHDPSGRSYYFISQVLPDSYYLNKDETADEVIRREAPYLDIILVSDIVGKRQNYIVLEKEREKFVRYLDLGCSFVNAIQGYLQPTNKIKMRRKSEKEFKRDYAKIKKWKIFANDCNEIKLEDVVALPEIMSVNTLNPKGSVKVSSLISKDEIDEIRRYLIESCVDRLPLFQRLNLATEI